MRHLSLTFLLGAALLVPGAPAMAAGGTAPTFHEEAGRAVGDLVDQLRGLAASLERHLRGDRAPGGPEVTAAQHPAERPLITLMLDSRADLALTPDQVSRLEALRQAFTRESIKRDADIRVAEMDLAALFDQDPLDLAKVEAKIQEIAKLRADLRIERLRTLEQGKALLTPEQKSRLRAILGGPGPRRAAREPVPGPAARI